MSDSPKINIDDFNKFIGRRLKDTSNDTNTYKVAAKTGELQYLNDAEISVFYALAGNEDKRLDEKEVNDLREAIGDKLQDKELSKKEVKQIINYLVSKGYEGLKNISGKDFCGFLYQLATQSKEKYSEAKVTNNEDGTETAGYCLSTESKDYVTDEYYDTEGKLLGREIKNNETEFSSQYNSEDKIVYRKQEVDGQTVEGTYTRNSDGKREFHIGKEEPLSFEKTETVAKAPAESVSSAKKAQKAQKTQKPKQNKVKTDKYNFPKRVHIPSKKECSFEPVTGPGYTTPVPEYAGKTIDCSNGTKIKYDKNGYIEEVLDRWRRTMRKVNKDFDSIHDYKYDRHGRKIEDKWIIDRNLASISKYSYDKHGNQTNVWYNYDEYDESNPLILIETTFTDLHGNKVSAQYDNKGRHLGN